MCFSITPHLGLSAIMLGFVVVFLRAVTCISLNLNTNLKDAGNNDYMGDSDMKSFVKQCQFHVVI